MKAQRLIREWEEWLPAEYHNAIEMGTNYDGFHESAETLSHHTVFCEEENGWYELYYGLDIIVDNGIPSLSIVRCWNDDWDHVYFYEPNKEVDINEIQRDADESWREREAWESKEIPCKNCVECGEDPTMVRQSDRYFPYCSDCHDSLSEQSEDWGNAYRWS